MDFELTAEQTALQDAARRFAQGELPAIASELERTGASPSRELKHRYAELGFLGVNVSTRFGGMGLGTLEALLVLEEFAKVSSAVAFPVFESSVGPIRAIETYGTDSLRDRLIPAVCRGDAVVAIAMSEPDAGSALTDLLTRATVSDGGIILNGAKRWCSGGGHADGYLVYARLTDEPGSKGIGAIYVDGKTAGVTFGAPEQLMGFRGIASADLYFDNVKVPLDHLVVPAGDGFRRLMQAFDLERCGNATMALAQAAAALDDVTVHVQQRTQFGRPVVEFQAVQLKLAEMRMRVDASRLLIHRAACNAAKGLPSLLDSSLAKCYANEIAREVTGNALQLMGAYGYSKSAPTERRFRDAWGWGIAGGTIDIQKINIAGAMIGRRFDQRERRA